MGLKLLVHDFDQYLVHLLDLFGRNDRVLAWWLLLLGVWIEQQLQPHYWWVVLDVERIRQQIGLLHAQNAALVQQIILYHEAVSLFGLEVKRIHRQVPADPLAHPGCLYMDGVLVIGWIRVLSDLEQLLLWMWLPFAVVNQSVKALAEGPIILYDWLYYVSDFVNQLVFSLVPPLPQHLDIFEPGLVPTLYFLK